MESESGVEIEIKNNNELGGEARTREDRTSKLFQMTSGLTYFHCTV